LDSHDHEPSYYEVALTNRQVVIGFVALLACVFTAFLAGVWLGRDAAPEAAEQVAEAAPSGVEGKRGKRMPKLTFFSETGAAEAPEDGRRAGRKRSGDAKRDGDAPEGEAGGSAEGAPEAKRGAAAAVRPGAAEAETLRQTLEAEMAANRQDVAAGTPPAASPRAEAGAPEDAADEVPLVPGARLQRNVPPAGAATSPAPSAAAPAPAPAAAAPAPVKAPASTSPAAPPASAATPFWIQVYSSSNGARAREIAAQLARSGFGVRVLEAGTTFRVRVGPYANRDLAEASASRLRREQKLDTWVTDQP
jgi:cell division protein FtsN